MKEVFVFIAGALLLWLTYSIGYFSGYGKGRLHEVTERGIRDIEERRKKREESKV